MKTRKQTNKIVIHCSATRANHNYSFEQCRSDHIKRGFSDIGYHFYLAKDGSIRLGRDMQDVGAHAMGHNSDSVAICYEGGLDKAGNASDTRTDEQKSAIRSLIAILRALYPAASVFGHRDLYGDTNKDGVIDSSDWLKQCPCFDAKKAYN